MSTSRLRSYINHFGNFISVLFVAAPSTINGISQIVYDNITEYPSTINVLKRFNLYPELIIGVWYRWFQSFTNAAKIKTQTCWKVSYLRFSLQEHIEGSTTTDRKQTDRQVANYP